jgi:hypothetical protein
MYRWTVVFRAVDHDMPDKQWDAVAPCAHDAIVMTDLQAQSYYTHYYIPPIQYRPFQCICHGPQSSILREHA